MIELRLQRGEAFGVAVDRLLHFAEQRFQAFEPVRDGTTPSGAISVTSLGDLRRGLAGGVTSTHGSGF